MTVKGRLELINENETARLWRKKGRGQELFCIVNKRNGKFTHRIKRKGKWEDFEGFPDKESLNQAMQMNFFKKLYPRKTKNEEEEEERDRDFLRPFR